MDGKWRIELTGSALKREYGRDDAIFVIRTRRLHAYPFEESRIPDTPDPAGWIGDALDGTEMEMFAEIHEHERRIRVFHLMPARPHIIRKIERAMNERKKQ